MMQSCNFNDKLVGRYMSLLSMVLWFHVEETPSGQKIVVSSALYIKQIKHININYIRMRRILQLSEFSSMSRV